MPPAAVDPRDGHDGLLLARVRPEAHEVSEPARIYDLVVLGAGTAGLVTAAGAASVGARVALVERELLGGDCLNTGCVPSKALIRSARAAADARRSSGLGVRGAEGARADFAAVMERMRRLRARLAEEDSAERFRRLGVHVFFGAARFTGPRTVEVGGRGLRFVRACIATGARPVVPPVPGLEEAGFLTNESLFGLRELPPRLGVLGGGPLGCEMAQAFARLGSRVTVIERGERVLGREPIAASELVQRALEEDGVEVRTGSRLERVERAGDGRRLHVSSARGRGTVTVDELLVSVGRRPNVEGLGLEDAGVLHDERGIEVTDRLRTSNRRILAAGDVCSHEKFTHAADAMARIVVRNALFFGRRRSSALTIPRCTYTDPEVAHVGLGEEEALRRGRGVRTVTVDLAGVDRAVLDSEEAGFLSVRVTPRSGRVLGATLVSRHAGETVPALALAVARRIRLASLSDLVVPYPTQAEALRRAGDELRRSRLTPGARRVLGSLLALRRRR